MDFVMLAATNNFILKPFAWLLGIIINGIYYVVSLLTEPQSMAITIVLMTLFVRLLITPLTVKQQKSSRRQQQIQPKIAAINAKYKDSKDPEIKQKMQAEISKVYTENKVSPLSGCLPLVIQLPIMFALYEVFRNIPFYVNDMKEMFQTMANEVMSIDGIAAIISEHFSTVTKSLKDFSTASQTSVMDFLYHLTEGQWNEFFSLTGLGSSNTFVEIFEKQKEINTVGFSIFTFNLSEAPGWKGPGIIIPLLAGGFTLLQTFISDRENKKRALMADPNYVEDETQKSTKMMMWISPVMIAFFAISLPVGLGIYWIASSVFGIISQVIVDKILDKQEYKEALIKKEEFEKNKLLNRSIIEANEAKKNFTQNAGAKSSLAGNKQAAIAQKQAAKNVVAEAEKKLTLQTEAAENGASSQELAAIAGIETSDPEPNTSATGKKMTNADLVLAALEAAQEAKEAEKAEKAEKDN